jgi:hypothetical protein
VVEVDDRGVDDPAQLQRLAQDEVGPAVVDVDLRRLGIPCDVDRFAGPHEVRADPVEVEELARKWVDEIDGLVAVAGLDVGELGRDRARDGRRT